MILSFILSVLLGLFENLETIAPRYPEGYMPTDLAKSMYILTNGTFIVGMLTASFGMLVLASNGGAFEMFVYGIRRFISLFQKDVNKVRFKTFYDYHVYKSSEPKKSFLYLVIVGLVFVAISGLFLALWYQYH